MLMMFAEAALSPPFPADAPTPRAVLSAPYAVTRAYISPGTAVVVEQGEGKSNINSTPTSFLSPAVSPTSTSASPLASPPFPPSVAPSRGVTASLDSRSIKRVGSFGGGGPRSPLPPLPSLPSGFVGNIGEGARHLSADLYADRSAAAEECSESFHSQSYLSTVSRRSSSSRDSRGRRPLSVPPVLRRLCRRTESNNEESVTNVLTGEAFPLPQEGRVGVKGPSPRRHIRRRANSGLDRSGAVDSGRVDGNSPVRSFFRYYYFVSRDIRNNS